MKVTDQHVETLRARLSGDSEEYDRLWELLDDESIQPYRALIIAAFANAAVRRFPKNPSRSDVVMFVADVRSRIGSTADKVDPILAERVVLAAVSDEDLSDVDGMSQYLVQVHLLPVMVSDEGLRGDDLDQFLKASRQLAERLVN